MNRIEYLNAVRLKENWHQLKPRTVPDCFEVYDEDSLMHYRRVGFSSIGLGSDFKDFVDNNIANRDRIVMSLHMGVDNEEITPFLELALLSTPPSAAPQGGRLPFEDSVLLSFEYSLNDWEGLLKKNAQGRPHFGVSYNYQQDCIRAWQSLEYENMVTPFFQCVKEVPGINGALEIKRPQRVTRFFIPDDDKNVLLDNISNYSQSDLNLFVFFGLNYNHLHVGHVSFTPIFIIENDAESSVESEGQIIEANGVAYLDFLHPCPPYCGDPPGTGGNG